MNKATAKKYHVMRRIGETYERVYSCDRAAEANAKVKAYGAARYERWTAREYFAWTAAKIDAMAKGEAWLKAHHSNVLNLLSGCQTAVQPSGEDLHNPALWKDIHWRWFFDRRSAN